jgi:hypothetical protein
MIRLSLRTLAWTPLVLLLTGASPALAGQATVSWNQNPELDVVGYYVNYGTSPGQYLYQFDAGPKTAFTFYGLPEGRAFFFSVQAYNQAGLVSPLSQEVTITLPGSAPTDANNNGLADAWESQYGVSNAQADDDLDGFNNLTEYHLGTSPRLPNTWQLAEGATGFFNERLALANPELAESQVSVTYLRESGLPIVLDYTVPREGRLTVDVNAIPGLDQAAVSAVVNTLRGGVVAERSMIWQSGGAAGGHTAKGTIAPATEWFFAEGNAGFFDTWLLVANSNPSTARVTFTFLKEDGSTQTAAYNVSPNSRFTLWTNAVAGLLGHGFSTRVTSTLPVSAERAMYFGRPTWTGGTGAAGVTSAANNWFIAEGRTGNFFDMWVLMANPNSQSATATVDYLLPGGGTPIRRQYTLPPTSRTTIHVDSVPGLQDTDVSASITSTRPIVVERAMYWPGTSSQWTDAHDSAGLTALGTEWLLAEGEFGGGFSYATYVLFSNPGTTAATLTMRVLREGGRPPIDFQRSVPAKSRVTVSAIELTALGLVQGERFGVKVNATQPIAVERSMYWNAGGQFWGGGTNEVGVRIR